MAFSSEIIARLGLDASGFSRGLDGARSRVEAWGDDATRVLKRKFGAGDLFKSILTGASIGSVQQIANALVAPFKDSAEAAEKIASATDQAADATERLIALRQTDAQQLATMEKQATRIANQLRDAVDAKPLEKFFGVIQRGSALDKIFGFSRRDDLSKQVTIQEKDAELKVKSFEVAQKQKQIEAKADAEAMKNAQADYDAAQKTADAKKKLADFEKSQRFEKMTDEQKLGELQTEYAKNAKDIRTIEEFRGKDSKMAAEHVEDLLGLKQRQVEIEGQLTTITERRADAEERAKRALEAQKTTIGEMRIFGIRGLKQFEGASDEELAQVIQRNKDALFDVSQRDRNQSQQFIAFGMEAARIQTENMNALQEQRFRQSFRQDLSRGGVEEARRNFKGDPLAFDEVLARLTQNFGKVDETNDLLGKISRTLETGINVNPVYSTTVLNGRSR